MDKFLGDLTDLKAIIQKMGARGAWHDLGSHICFRSRDGVVLLGWYKKRTLQFQGPPAKAARFRARFIDAAGDKYRCVLVQNAFFGDPIERA